MPAQDTSPPAPPAVAESGVLKVLTLNTHKGFTTFNRRLVLHELRDAVRAIGADVVFLQEVIGEHSAHPARFPHWPEKSQYEFLADSIWQAYAYGRNASYPEGHHGNALLSKYPIARQQNHDLSVSGPERRGVLHCILDLPGRAVPLHAMCVHLGLLGSHRLRQMDMMCEVIERDVPADAPLIVAGDFNDWRIHANSRLMQRAGLREVFLEHQGTSARTFPARWPLLRLDRIYVRNANVRSLSVLSKHPWSHLSDHAGLFAELGI